MPTGIESKLVQYEKLNLLAKQKLYVCPTFGLCECDLSLDHCNGPKNYTFLLDFWNNFANQSIWIRKFLIWDLYFLTIGLVFELITKILP